MFKALRPNYSLALVELGVAAFGGYLLWGVGVRNGMLIASKRALKRGQVLTHYTGIASLDRMVRFTAARKSYT